MPSAFMQDIKVHAYTDDTGLTLFAVDFGDRVLKFGAYISNFELETTTEDITSVFHDYRTLARRETTINIEARVIDAPMYEHAPKPQSIDYEVKQIPPGRKELEP